MKGRRKEGWREGEKNEIRDVEEEMMEGGEVEGGDERMGGGVHERNMSSPFSLPFIVVFR